MKRRSLLQATGIVALPSIWGSPTASAAPSPSKGLKAGLGPKEVVFASTLDLSGPLASAGQVAAAGLQAAFAEANAAGGIHGRQLRLNIADDAYDPERTVAQLERLVAEEGVFALLGCQGTANAAAIIPMTERLGIPMIGPSSGASSLRKRDYRTVFHLRASYSEETVSLTRHLLSMGLRSIAIVHLDNPFGQEVAHDAHRIISNEGLEVVTTLTLSVDGGNAEAVAQEVLAARPSAVLLGTSGVATLPLLQRLKAQNPGMPLAGLSVSMTGADVARLGTAAKGILMSRVVPLAERPTTGISRAFQAAMRIHQPDITLDHRGLESYITARVAIEGLQRSGRYVTRNILREHLANLRALDLGGFKVAFQGSSPFVGSRFTELGVLGAHGGAVS